MRMHARSISFSRVIMAGFFAGIIAAAANFLFVFFFRTATGVDALNDLVSPLFIFTGFPILLTLTGMLYFAMKWYMRKGGGWYTGFIILLTLFALIMDLLSPGEITLAGYKGLLFGMEIITGFIAAFLLPYLARHPKLFMTQQGLRESR